MDYVERAKRKAERMRDTFELRLKGFLERRRKEGEVEVGLESLGMTTERTRCLKARHDGQRCFIIASGPSLKEQDIDWLRNEITIGVNGIPKYLGETYGWAPTYNVITDGNPKFCPKLLDISLAYSDSQLVVSSYVADEFKGKLPPNHVMTVQYPASNTRASQCDHVNHFLDERPHLIGSGGYVVSDTAVPLAMYLGCNQIYIVGQDHNTETSVVPLQKGKRTHGQAAADISTCTFILLQEYAKQCGFQLFNASKAQNLKVLPFANLDDLTRDTPTLPALSRTKNIHKGQRCFIIRSGLSLNRLMLSELRNEITIAVDDAYLCTSTWGFAPTYGCLSESSTQDAYKDLQQLGARIVAPGTRLQAEGFHGFPADDLKPFEVHTAEAIAYATALHTGCDAIYLAGFDAEPSGRSYDPYSEISSAFTSKDIQTLHEGLEQMCVEVGRLQRRILFVSGQPPKRFTKIPFTHLFRAGPVSWNL